MFEWLSKVGLPDALTVFPLVLTFGAIIPHPSIWACVMSLATIEPSAISPFGGDFELRASAAVKAAVPMSLPFLLDSTTNVHVFVRKLNVARRPFRVCLGWTRSYRKFF